MLWDGGSTLSFITIEKARSLKLKGRPVKLKIVTFGGVQKTIDSELYKVTLLGKNGVKVFIEVLGIERISTPMNAVNFEDLDDPS